MAEKNTLEYSELKKILPHAHPFLLIDRVEEYKVGESLTAIKNVTGNEWALEGGVKAKYFPETLMIEAAAQAALVLYHVSKVAPGQKRPRYFLGRTKAEFFRQVEAGEQLVLDAYATKLMLLSGFSEVKIKIGIEAVAEFAIFYSVEIN